MRLTRYLLGELIPPLIVGTLLFTAVLSFGYFFVSAQWLSGVPAGLVSQWIGYQVPDTLVKVLPMGVVLMVVVAYGRLASERELVAMQSGGVGLGFVARPAAILALLVAVLAVWLSLWVAPNLNVSARGLYWDTLTRSGLQQLVGRQVDLGNNLSLYLGGYDNATRQLQAVRVEQWSRENPQQGTLIFARGGTFEGGQLRLTGYTLYTLNYGQIAALEKVPDNNDAAFRAAAQDVFTAVNIPSSDTGALVIDTGLSRRQTIAQYADAIGADGQTLTSLLSQLRDPAATPAARQQARVDLNRKLALPFGNLVLALAALPFALRYGRSLGVSLGIALLIAVAYYLLFVVGLTLANAMPSLTELWVWLADLVFAVAGLSLLRRT